MKISAMMWLASTTILLATVTIFASLQLSFSFIFYLTVLGQGLLVFTVYKVLTDNYQTSKTFDDFYEDRPVEKYR